MMGELELWQVGELGNEVIPLFLVDRGDFSKLYPKFKENKNTIITNIKGKTIKTHYE